MIIIFIIIVMFFFQRKQSCFRNAKNSFFSRKYVSEAFYQYKHLKPIYIFWTGGYDSTFLLCDRLLSSNRFIQPVYISDKRVDTGSIIGGRQNKQMELKAREKITNKLSIGYPLDIHRLLPVIYVSGINLDHDIVQACHELHKLGYFSRNINQYSYMAQCTRLLDVTIETGSEKGTNSILSKVVEGKLDDKWMLRQHAKPVAIHIFDNIRFPLNQTTKEKMLFIAKSRGFEDILHDTVSCWYPNRKPCGNCHMCLERII